MQEHDISCKHAQLLRIADCFNIPYFFDHSANLTSGFSRGIYRKWPIIGSAGGPGGRGNFDLYLCCLSQRMIQVIAINHKIALIVKLRVFVLCWMRASEVGWWPEIQNIVILIDMMTRSRDRNYGTYIWQRSAKSAARSYAMDQGISVLKSYSYHHCVMILTKYPIYSIIQNRLTPTHTSHYTSHQSLQGISNTYKEPSSAHGAIRFVSLSTPIWELPIGAGGSLAGSGSEERSYDCRCRPKILWQLRPRAPYWGGDCLVWIIVVFSDLIMYSTHSDL